MTLGSGLLSGQKARIPHLVTAGTGGLGGEIYDLRHDMMTELAPLAAIAVEEFTNVVGTAAPGPAVILAATPSVEAEVTVLASGMLAAGLAHLAAWPRPLTFTTGGTGPADAPANVAITGTDPWGVAQTETLNLAQTAAMVTSTKAWSSIVKVVYPAADHVDATVSIGVGAAYLKKATAVATTAVTVLASDLIQTDLVNCPRALVFSTTGSTPADAPAHAVITGTDLFGHPVVETLDLAQTVTTATTTYCYRSVSSVVYEAGQGTDAAIAITFAAPLGLGRKCVARAGIAAPPILKEIAGGSVVTNGVLALPVALTSGLPHGTYAPNTPADGATDYAIYYEYDPAAAT
jgi:hypothetical protein